MTVFDILQRGERLDKVKTHQDSQACLVWTQGTGLRIGLWDWDLVTNVVSWSNESYRQWGYTRETFSGRIEDAVARIHPEDRSMVEEAIRTVLAGNQEFTARYRIVRPDQTTCWIDAYGALFHPGAIHMIGVGIDITDLTIAEQSVQSAREEVVRCLTTSIAHELSQPLTCVLTNGYASQRWLAIQPPDLDKAREAVGETLRQADRACQALTRIRDMSSRRPLQYLLGLPKVKGSK
jgi:PAS domain S-box-containing protein